MSLQGIIQKIGEVITIRVLSLTLTSSVVVYMLVNGLSSNVEEAPVADGFGIDKQLALNDPVIIRKPSSSGRKDSVIYKPTAKLTSYNQSNFGERLDPLEQSRSANRENSSSFQSMFSNTPTTYPLIRQVDLNENSLAKTTNQQSAETEQVFLGTTSVSTKDKKLDVKKSAGSEDTSSPSFSLFANSNANTCSTNIVSGTFGNPVGITLACTHSSTIKYCLSAGGSCCDPESGGVIYSSQVIIGPQDGNYCLSYIGDSDSGGSSVVYEQTYIINSTLPNLNVGHEKIFYQTTELEGTSFISSTDFGKANHSVGQINLKSHDPGSDPGGLNYSCEEIIANYVALPTPTAIEVLTLFDVSLAPLASQVEIPLRLDQLDYGDNFITSYIENNSYVAPLYSCSTTKVNLDDFEYFQSDISQGEVGDNSVREFEGEFSSYSFFEKDIEVSRGPAGINTEENTGENLKSGMYGMFY